MRRSSILMLAAAIMLGLVAVFFARTFLLPGATVATGQSNVRTVSAVVASEPIAFGEKIVPEKLKLVQWPAEGVPPGSFQRIFAAVGDDGRVALRPIDANELITQKSMSGKEGRLSASPLLGATMRAVAVPVGEVSGAAGFIVPGDRVDVYMTKAGDNEELPYTDQLMQAVRVLAVGQDNNLGKDKPEVVKTATIEVTPLQAQKIALAMSVGQLSLSLRNIADDSRVPLQTAQIFDLNDGTVTRILHKPKSNMGPQIPVTGAPMPPRPSGPSIEIFRGNKPTSYPVPTGS
jgi:pilus assembly protein CpaB